MEKRSRSSLFLMEQLIVILIFALCAASCVRIFTASYVMARDSRDLKNALRLAESIAECYKAVGNSVEVAAILSTEAEQGTVLPTVDGAPIIFFDQKMRATVAESAVYMASLREYSATERVRLCDVSVSHMSGTEILTLTVAARGGVK